MAPAGSLPLVLQGVLSFFLASAAVPTPQEQPAGLQNHASFHSFIRQYDRPYQRGSREYEERLELFSLRATEVARMNSRPNRLWTATVNALSDRTETELQQLRGWRGGATPGGGAGAVQGFSAGSTFLKQARKARPLPREHTNWTRLNTMIHKIDQGGCGSCWAVTSITVLKAHSEIYMPERQRSFSAQELLSCMPNPQSCGGDGGCQGATVELAMNFAMKQGLADEEQAPYQGVTGRCQRQAASSGAMLEGGKLLGAGDVEGAANLQSLTTPGVHLAQATEPGQSFGMRGWERLPENGYEALLRALVERGPVAVSVAASAWSSYGSGIFDGCDRDAVINHAVTLIGFGEDAALQKQYYLIQNSWGAGWGEGGNIRLLRRDSDGERCGVDRQPEVGTGCKGGPKEVRVCGMCGILYDSVVPYFA